MITDSFSKKIRNHIGVNGLISLIVGLLILFWPRRTAFIATLLLGIAFIAIGLFYIITSFTTQDESGWGRVGHILLGILYMVAGVFCIIDLASTTAYLFLFVGIFVGITWIMEGCIGFGSMKYTPSKGWTIFSSVLSIIAGIFLLFTPFLGAAFLWILLGVALVVLGITKIIRYFTWGK
jgi:uncharacterized membrane protein HdeD (DUF308 family)